MTKKILNKLVALFGALEVGALIKMFLHETAKSKISSFNKDGKGHADEALFAKALSRLSTIKRAEIALFSSKLAEMDKANGTKLQEKFILFIATMEEQFSSDTTPTDKFLNDLSTMSFDIQMEFCKSYHIFNEPLLGVRLYAEKVMGTVKKVLGNLNQQESPEITTLKLKLKAIRDKKP